MTTIHSAHGIDAYAKSVGEIIPEEYLLGNILWFSISEADVHYETAKRELENRGLSTEYLRKRLRPIDAFKKAARDIERKFPMRDDGIQSRFMANPVGHDRETSHRHVVLERAHVATGKKRRLVYDTLTELVFHRGEINEEGEYHGFRIDIIRKNLNLLDIELTDQEDAWLESMLNGMVSRFDHYRTHLDSHAVRSYVRDHLNGLFATCVKSNGGVYFVQQKHTDTVAALSDWVRSIGSEFHMMPLVDLGDQRQMVRDAYEDEVIGEVERLSSEIAKVLNKGSTITEGTFDAYNDRVAELMGKHREYSEMLDDKLQMAQERIDIFKRQTLTLVDRIKTPKGKV